MLINHFKQFLKDKTFLKDDDNLLLLIIHIHDHTQLVIKA